MLRTPTEVSAPRRRIQSIEVGFRLLRALEAAGGPLPLKEIAAASRMSPSKAYVYLTTFVHEKVVEQDPVTGHYRFGPFTIQLGLAALRQADVITLARDRLLELREMTRCAACLSVWGNRGPTIALKFDGDRQGSFVIRVGHVLSLQRSATGRVFLAHLPKSVTEPVAAWEAATRSGDKALFARERARTPTETSADIRKNGYSTAAHEGANGFKAISAPVFDYSGNIAAAITMLGPKDLMTTDQHQKFVRLLLDATNEISAQLGYAPGAPRPAMAPRSAKSRGATKVAAE